jgi:uncharacterized protein YjdB
MRGRVFLMFAGSVCLALPFAGCSSNQVDAITVTPTTTNFQGLGGSVQMKAIGTVNHGAHPPTYEDITDRVAWSTPLASVMKVTPAGLVTVIGEGSTQVVATMQGYGGVVSGDATICAQPTNATNGSFTCSAATGSVRRPLNLSFGHIEGQSATAGETRQFTVTGTSASGEQRDVTDKVKWTSSDESFATVDNFGGVTALSRGKSTIMASVTQADRTVVSVATELTVKE